MGSGRTWLVAAWIAALGAVIGGCGRDLTDPREPYIGPIDPETEPDELNRALVVEGSNLEGAIPSPSSGTIPQFVSAQSSASVTADNNLYLPFGFSSAVDIAGLYISVEGAENYWDVDLPDAGTHGTRVVPIGIPSSVIPGEFSLIYQIYDTSGQVSLARTLPTSIVPPTSGSGGPITFPLVQGSDGLTVRTYALGSNSGTVSILWETYQVPDRVDIRAGGEWVASTGTQLDILGAPPILDCSDAATADGFVGSSGTFSFELDPSRPGLVDIYMSGCMNGGTAWYFQVSFAPAIDIDASIPDCPCKRTQVRIGSTYDANGNVTGAWSDATAFGRATGTLMRYHPGAAFDLRWTPHGVTTIDPSTGSPVGQQCTYDIFDGLITSGLGAGSLDLVAPGVSTYGHRIADVTPWETEPHELYVALRPTNRGVGCLEVAVTPYLHLGKMIRGMTLSRISDLINAVLFSKHATDGLRSYVSAATSSPGDATLARDLKAIIDGEGRDPTWTSPGNPRIDLGAVWAAYSRIGGNGAEQRRREALMADEAARLGEIGLNRQETSREFSGVGNE